MRPYSIVLAASALLLVSLPARASEPDTGLALLTAAALDTAGFVVGGALIGTSPSGGTGDAQRSFGWLAIQAGFTLSPLAAHGVVGEWDRGALFAAAPAAALAGTAGFYRWKTDGVIYGTWEEQWMLWGLFTTGLVVSTVGAVDVLFAGNRRHPPALAVRPTLGLGEAGLRLEGSL
jgi:hypothetical protein